jgi:L-serine kinase (ADP)
MTTATHHPAKLAPVELVDPKKLRHIEGFSKKRAVWLREKILSEGIWTKPLAIDRRHFLVMDGQHRMEVALALGLRHVPCKLFDYDQVEVWSLRPDTHEVTTALIIERALSGDIYPYKTAKHRFPEELDELSIKLDELR